MSRELSEAEQNARAIGKMIKECKDPRLGFLLILFDKENDGNSFFTYLSDCEREGMVNLLREFANKLEGQQCN